MIGVQILGMDKLEKRFSDIDSNTPLAMRKALNTAASMVRASASKSIKKQTSGEPYTRYLENNGGPPSKRTGIASSPGDAPNDDLGNLVSNIIISSGTAIATKKYEVLVRSQAPYSIALEKGAPRINLRARPFMKPALEKNKEKIRSMIRKAVNDSL
jgi:HK97 gp10 family phage protein